MSIRHEGRRIHRTVHGPNDYRGQRAAEQALDLLIRQHGPGYRFGDITVPELLASYLENRRPFWNDNSYRTKSNAVRPIAASLSEATVRGLTHAQIRAAADGWRREGLSETTIYGRVGLLKSALLDAVRAGMLDASPAQGFLNMKGKPRVPPILDIAVVHQRVRLCPMPKMRMLALLALATGARRGELLALQWDDIDFDKGEIRVAHSLSSSGNTSVRHPTKTGRVHSIAVDAWTMDELRTWKTSPDRQAQLGRGGRTKWVFFKRGDNTKPWSPSGASSAWLEQRAQFGLADIRLQDLRHLHATAALGAGVPVHAVAERLAHASPAMVIRTYGHAIPAHDQHIAAIMGSIFGKNSDVHQPLHDRTIADHVGTTSAGSAAAAAIGANLLALTGQGALIGGNTTIAELETLAIDNGINLHELLTPADSLPVPR